LQDTFELYRRKPQFTILDVLEHVHELLKKVKVTGSIWNTEEGLS
jgi:hypothetical protein